MVTTEKQFIELYILGDRTLTNLNTLGELVPKSSEDLRSLQQHCLTAAVQASEAGRQIEARRLGDIARQLAKRADDRAAQ
jgi:hypothetical protein